VSPDEFQALAPLQEGKISEIGEIRVGKGGKTKVTNVAERTKEAKSKPRRERRGIVSCFKNRGKAGCIRRILL
jgi:hypothetical protein